MSNYRPTSCQHYAELEIAIVHQLPLRVAWHTAEGDCRMEPLLPMDLRTREKEEYLLAEDRQGDPLEIRLDWIARFSPL